MKRILLITCLINCFYLSARVVDSGLFSQYPNKYFVETGSFQGQGIHYALESKCFKEIHSIELAPKYYEFCKNRFKNNPMVQLHLGDSGMLLAKVIKKMDKPITFWLDGHYSGLDTAHGNKACPILDELNCIKSHPIKTHTIIVDDISLLGTKHFDMITLNQLKQKILEINPNYVFSIVDTVQKHDGLVALVPSVIKAS